VIRPNVKSNIDLTVDCPPGIVVRSYPLLFSQVVTNLISNANQHAFPDSDDPGDKITIVCRDAGKDLIVKCIDNGIGIPEGELDKLCQPFVSKKRTNLGLGLALVKNIVEQYMKGEISFASERGLTVTVRIPGCIIKK
jgi:signal transduction histidine kinase